MGERGVRVFVVMFNLDYEGSDAVAAFTDEDQAYAWARETFANKDGTEWGSYDDWDVVTLMLNMPEAGESINGE